MRDYEPILVFALDAAGHEMNTPHHEGECNRREARLEAQRLLRDAETRAAGLHKVEIRQGGIILADYFV